MQAVIARPPASEDVRSRSAAGAQVKNILVCAFFFALTVSLQLLSGAYRAELGQYPDEPAHVITTLMFGDYVRAGFPESPVSYAEKYYVHYPKVAIGMWPPLFYCMAGAWTLIFGASHVSLLLFAAFLGAVLCACLAVFVKRLYGWALGLAAGGLLALLAPVQSENSMVMLDIAVALACFWSMLLLVQYFRDARLRTALAFGAMTAAAMLVKGNANACVLMVPFMLLLTGRFDLLKRPGLYAAGAIILVFGLPWQIVSLKMLQSSVPMASVGVAYFSQMLVGYTHILAGQLTPLPSALIVVALTAAAVPALRRAVPDAFALAGAASLFLAILVFHCVAPNPGPDERYVMAALPPAVALFVAGCCYVSRLRIPAVPNRAARTAILVGGSLLSAYLFGAFAVPHFPVLGFASAAKMAMASNAPSNAMLICSDSAGEGAFVAEVALHDRRPSRIVLRASKIVWHVPWSGGDIEMLFHTATDLAEYLEAVAVDVAVVDVSTPRVSPGRALLLACFQKEPTEWRAAEVKGDHERKLVVYTRRDRSSLSPGPIRIALPHTLGRDVGLN